MRALQYEKETMYYDKERMYYDLERMYCDMERMLLDYASHAEYFWGRICLEAKERLLVRDDPVSRGVPAERDRGLRGGVG